MTIGLFINANGLTGIPNGESLLQTSGYRAAGKGPGVYVRDDTLVTAAYQAAHPTWTFRANDVDGSSHGYRLVPDGDGSVKFDSFGAYRDGSSDDFPAWTACQDFLEQTNYLNPLWTSDYRALIPVRFGIGEYRFSSYLEIKRGTHHLIGGALANAASGAGTIFAFAADQHGLIFELTGTAGTGTGGPARGAYGSQIENIQVRSLGGTSLCHGFWVRCGNIRLINCVASDWMGDGLHVVGTIGAGGENEGIADSCFTLNFIAIYCTRDGIHSEGGDANAGLHINPEIRSVGRWAVYENGFLANQYYGGQIAGAGDIGFGSRTGSTNTKAAVCVYGGSRYAVRYGQETAASTTTPGTNAAVWYLIPLSSGASPSANQPAWVTGMAWQAGGVALFINPNAPCAFRDVYVEGGSAPIQNVAGRAMIEGGFASQSVMDGVGGSLQRQGVREFLSPVVVDRGVTDPTYGRTRVQIGSTAPSNLTVLGITHDTIAPTGFNYSFNQAAGLLELRYGGLDPAMVSYAGPASTRLYGRSSPVTNPAIQIYQLFVGFSNLARQLTFSTGAPTSGSWGRGDIVFDINADATGLAGWVCTTAGSPGTWRRFFTQAFSGSKVFDWPSIAAGQSSTTTVSVSGAVAGDGAVASMSSGTGGLILFAQGTAANIVTVTAFNPTAAAIDLPSGTLAAKVVS